MLFTNYMQYSIQCAIVGNNEQQGTILLRHRNIFSLSIELFTLLSYLFSHLTFSLSLFCHRQCAVGWQQFGQAAVFCVATLHSPWIIIQFLLKIFITTGSRSTIKTTSNDEDDDHVQHKIARID